MTQDNIEDKKLVSDKEMEAVETEIRNKQAEEMKKLSEEQAKSIEERVRKEFAEKAEKEKMQLELENLKKADEQSKKELEQKLKAQEEAFQKRLEEIESQRKGAVRNESPFSDKDANNPNIKILPDGSKIDISKLDMKEVEKLSAEAFAEYLGYPRNTFTK